MNHDRHLVTLRSMHEYFRGCLLGLAVGDALGTTLEFTRPGEFEPIDDIVGGGPFQLEPGQWTDDTSMALCLAESLITCKDFDPVDQLERYTRWYREGHLSSTGVCFDIGNATRGALKEFEQTGAPYCGSEDPHTAGNGSIMRLAPVPLFFTQVPRAAMLRTAESSRTTHGTLETVDACRYLAGIIIGAVQGRSKDELLSPHFCPVEGLWADEPLSPKIDEIASGSFKRLNPPEIRGTGYVVNSLEAALWAFYQSSTFREGALMAVNLGEDADTTGAVYGQIAGAFYGVSQIPVSWLRKLALRDKIEQFADSLLELSSEQYGYGSEEHIEAVDKWLDEHMRSYIPRRTVTLFAFDIDWDGLKGTFRIKFDEKVCPYLFRLSYGRDGKFRWMDPLPFVSPLGTQGYFPAIKLSIAARKAIREGLLSVFPREKPLDKSGTKLDAFQAEIDAARQTLSGTHSMVIRIPPFRRKQQKACDGK